MRTIVSPSGPVSRKAVPSSDFHIVYPSRMLDHTPINVRANKSLHPTARSLPVSGVLCGFTDPPPFQRLPPLLAVDEL